MRHRGQSAAVNEDRRGVMELRAFGNADMKVSPLGFGVIRLPMKDGGKTVNSMSILR